MARDADERDVFVDAATVLSTSQRWKGALRRELDRPTLSLDSGAEVLEMIASGELERGTAAAARLRVATSGGAR